MFFDSPPWAYKFLFLIAAACLLGNTNSDNNPIKKRFRIEDGSKLYLKGTSNVNAFTCDCQDQYCEQTLEADYNGGYARFKNADLTLKSKKFDCHNRKIDCDMQKALKSDQYPLIKISLLETSQNPKSLNGGCKDWFDVQANVKITITNVTKTESIPAKAKVLGPDRFLLQGENALQMSAYGINPPEALFGMIKVNDWITFHFDLIVSIGEVQ
ncbi:MAG: YceI family protein [Bacteroidota bacterium]